MAMQRRCTEERCREWQSEGKAVRSQAMQGEGRAERSKAEEMPSAAVQRHCLATRRIAKDWHSKAKCSKALRRKGIAKLSRGKVRLGAALFISAYRKWQRKTDNRKENKKHESD